MHWSRAYRVIVAIGFVYMETYPNVDWCPNRITDCLGGHQILILFGEMTKDYFEG